MKYDPPHESNPTERVIQQAQYVMFILIIMLIFGTAIDTQDPIYYLTITLCLYVIQSIFAMLVTNYMIPRDSMHSFWMVFTAELFRSILVVFTYLYVVALAGPNSWAWIFQVAAIVKGAFNLKLTDFFSRMTNLDNTKKRRYKRIWKNVTIIRTLLVIIANALCMYYIGCSNTSIRLASYTLLTSGVLALLLVKYLKKLIVMQRQHSEILFKNLYMHAPIMFFAIDRTDLTILNYNRCVTETLGYTETELQYRQFITLFGSQYREKVFHALQNVEINDKIDDLKVLSKKERYPCDVSMHLSVIPGLRGGKSQSIHVILHDVTAANEARAKEEKLNAELSEAKEKALQANNAKSVFLATMSHEIRTPLHGVICACELLQETQLTAEQYELMDIIQISGDILLQTINNILDFAKIEAGQLHLEKIGFDVQECIQRVISVMRIQAEKKNIKLIAHLSNMPQFVLGDPSRLAQVMINLVNNAIKFTGEGGLISVSAAPEQVDQQINVLFNVKDSGIGIPKSKQHLLFQHFSQLHGSHIAPGTGLGLAIAKNIVEQMSGKIWVESEVGQGSNFYFTVAFDVYGNTSPTSTTDRQTVDLITDKSILVAEDNAINRAVIKRILVKLGCTNIEEAVDGKEAYIACQRKHFDLILMDCNMPVMDGLTATKLIRKWEVMHNNQRKTRIIALTANATIAERERCLQCGMDDFLSKPVRMNTIRDILSPSSLL